METDQAEILIQRNHLLLALAEEIRLVCRGSVDTARDVRKTAAAMQQRAVVIAERTKVVRSFERQWLDEDTRRK